MTAIIYGTAPWEELTWSRRAAVFEFLLDDIAECVRDEDLREVIAHAEEIQGLDLDALSNEHLSVLKSCAERVREEYVARKPNASQTDPDYDYMIDAVDELLGILAKLVQTPTRPAHGP